MRVKVLVFDLDDTLIPSTDAYKEAMRATGLASRAASFRRAREAVKRRLGSKHPSSHNRLLYFKEMLESSREASPKKILALTNRYEAALIRIFKREWKASGLSVLLARLARRYRLAIVSNENTRTQLLKLAIVDPHGRFFSVVVTSEEVGVEKPDRAIFKEAFRRLKVSPRACAMIGDNLEHDIIPMRALGARVFYVEKPSDLWLLPEFLQ